MDKGVFMKRKVGRGLREDGSLGRQRRKKETNFPPGGPGPGDAEESR